MANPEYNALHHTLLVEIARIAQNMHTIANQIDSGNITPRQAGASVRMVASAFSKLALELSE